MRNDEHVESQEPFPILRTHYKSVQYRPLNTQKYHESKCFRNRPLGKEGYAMPKLTNRFLTMYRDKNTAVSKHKGQRIYHGVWGSPEADKSYKRFIATLLENPLLPLRIGKEDALALHSQCPTFVLKT